MVSKYSELKNSPFRLVFRGFIILLSLAALSFFWIEQKKERAQKTFFASEAFKNHTEQLSKAFNDYMSSEKNNQFFLHKYNDKSKNINKLISKIYETAQNKKLTDEMVQAQIISDSSELIELTDDFSNHFQDIIATEKNLGDENFGLAQALKDASDQLALQPQLQNDSSLKTQIAELHKLSSRYQNRHSEATEKKYLRQSKNLINKLKAAKNQKLSAKEKTLVDALQKHRTRFTAYVRAVDYLGRSPQEGLLKEAYGTLADLEKIAQQLYQTELENFNKRSSRYRNYTLIVISLSLIIPLLLGIWIYRRVNRHFEKIDVLLQYLKEGEINNFYASSDIKSFPMIRTIRDIFSELQTKNQHILNVSQGKTEEDKFRYDLHDVLGQSLIKLEESVTQAQKEKEEELRKKEREDHRIRGLTKFAAIMRDNAGKADALAQAVTNELVDFLNIELGGFYILNPEKQPSEYILSAAFAYNEEKIVNAAIPAGKGLIGTAASDKIAFYYDELPEDYLSIVTGFGQTPPKAMYIQPLITGDTVVGVLEMAALRPFSEYDIDFIKSLSGDIASALRYIILEKA